VSERVSGELVGAPAGVVYSCSGDAYLEEALRSARSSLRHNRLPHVLFTTSDAPAEEGLQIVRFEPSENPYVDKIANMRRSPFERTIYLDTDTYVVEEIIDVLALLDRFDVAAAFAPGYRGLADPQVPRAFYELNTGVLAWRASMRVAAFMRSWQETYLAWLGDEPFAGAGRASAQRVARGRETGRSQSIGGAADQPAFRRCAWQHEVSLLVLGPEYNLRLGEPTAIVDRVRVIHGRPGRRSFEELAQEINETLGPRTWPRSSAVRITPGELRRRWRARRHSA
jgi:hypothetical protein